MRVTKRMESPTDYTLGWAHTNEARARSEGARRPATAALSEDGKLKFSEISRCTSGSRAAPLRPFARCVADATLRDLLVVLHLHLHVERDGLVVVRAAHWRDHNAVQREEFVVPRRIGGMALRDTQEACCRELRVEVAHALFRVVRQCGTLRESGQLQRKNAVLGGRRFGIGPVGHRTRRCERVCRGAIESRNREPQ